MINWIIGNKEEHKIEYVITLGDLTQQSYTAEWDYIRSQFYRLNGLLPFMMTPGNHDRRDPEVKQMTEYGYDIWPEELRKNAYFHEIFGDEIYRSQIDGNMYDWDMANTYNAFSIGDVKYLLLSLDYGASDEMLEWASGIVEQHADHRVIVVTHAYLYRDGTTVDAYDTYPATRIDG
jgi:predicted MPP superfamily phosphohydrolase